MIYKEVSFVLGSKLSNKILECLNNASRPLAPIQISKATGIARSNVSTKLGELLRRNLVKCINPQARKWRFYIITDKGKKVLKEIKVMEK